MSFKNTLELVTKDIQEIEKIVSKFQNYSRIPAIELDLTLNKLQNLYELLLLIRDYEGQNPKPKQEMNNESLSSPDNISAEKVYNEPVSKPESTNVYQNEKITENSLAGTEKKEQAEEDISQVKKTGIEAKDKTLAEKLEKPGEFLNEKLAQSNHKPTHLQGGHISNISGSLGINDRFYYIREIFEGNSDQFKKSLEQLDSVSNFNEAYNYLKTHVMCDMDSEPVQNLLNLVRRKFINPGNE